MKNVRNGTVAAYSMTPSVSPSWAKSARVVSSWDSVSFDLPHAPGVLGQDAAHPLAQPVDEIHEVGHSSRIRTW